MSYMPRRDAAVLAWSRNFQTRLTALPDPTVVGLSAQNVTDYTAAQADYQVRYDLAKAPSTRGLATVQAKNESKDALVAMSRSFAMTITNAQGVTDQQRHDFGLTVRDGELTPVPAPDFAPEIDVFPPVVRTVRLRLSNQPTLGRRGKPEGAIGATIFSCVGELPPALDRPELWKFEMNTGETTAEITFPSTVPAGSTAWFTASWYNRRGEQSPRTRPVNVNLPGTLQQAA